ncbi:hypothetical protein M8J75_006005 [Diaphorina citri]|nr:hypothetical protein M8J75_006005 [Diaphorina citri]
MSDAQFSFSLVWCVIVCVGWVCVCVSSVVCVCVSSVVCVCVLVLWCVGVCVWRIKPANNLAFESPVLAQLKKSPRTLEQTLNPLGVSTSAPPGHREYAGSCGSTWPGGSRQIL